MIASARKLTLAVSAFALPLALAACGSNDEEGENLEALDESLTDLSDDPAMNDALSDQILVDPDLTDQANANAVRRPDMPADGSAPPGASYAGAAENGRDAANAQFSGGLMSAPAPRQMTSDDECSSCGGGGDGMTLGAKADAQLAQRGKGSCDQKLNYNMAWAERMPPEFPVYPRANVQEAAGVEGGLCDLRVVSFTSAVDMKNIVDYYYTKAKQGGFSAEYLLRGSEHVLGGTRDRDGGAFVITLNSAANGRTAVDIVASNGR